ncbi:MAG: NrfD/PsrC family molybdoenzyme membrane anchor subunit [Solirubrobacteraceae bacterium]
MSRGGDGAVGYYGRPVIKQPVWTWEIPLYFATGGVSGASAGLAFAAELAGNHPLARRAQLAAFGAIAASPALLISDLGRPSRFYNMLRVFKLSSPMSVGSWLLSANGAATGLATFALVTGRLPRAGRAARAAAAVLGMPLTTYTAVLIADTAVPFWHEGRRELPFVFGGSSAAGAGALAALLTPPEHAGPARALAIVGSVIEGTASVLLQRRLGELAQPLRSGTAGKLALAAKGMVTVGAALVGAGAVRVRTARSAAERAGLTRGGIARAGAALVLAGETVDRYSIFRAGFQSAADPEQTVGPQRRRLASASASGIGAQRPSGE